MFYCNNVSNRIGHKLLLITDGIVNYRRRIQN